MGRACRSSREEDGYVRHHANGADCAQLFTAGQFTFLHIGLQYHAPDSSLQWAGDLLQRYPHLPVIVTTHDYLRRDGSVGVNAQPFHCKMGQADNSSQLFCDKFISKNDQISHVTLMLDSERQGREQSPTADVLDRQSVDAPSGAKPQL